MAGFASDFSLPNSSFFNIYTDGGPAARRSPMPSLPVGQCNFVDLAHGANGLKCGCRRFWSRGASGQSSPGVFPGFPSDQGYGRQDDQAFYCMCSHHACFHDDAQGHQHPAAPLPDVAVAGQENERPRGDREPLTPVVQELSFQMPPPAATSINFLPLNNASLSAQPLEDRGPARSEVATATGAPSIPDTLSWANFINSQGDQQPSLMPPIPSQCLLSSQPTSTTSSARSAYMRPFQGKGLQTLSGVKSKLREATQPDKDARSPEVELAPDTSVDGLQTVTNTPRSTRQAESGQGSQQRGDIPEFAVFQQLSSTVQSHEQRLDRLETVSFSADAHEECHALHDSTDIRVTELEGRMDEVEKLLSDTSSQALGQTGSRFPGPDDSTASVVSVSTHVSGGLDRSELYEELQALKAQLSRFQGLNSFPSYNNPWEIEVVFLPFPLKGVWMDCGDFPSQHAPGSNAETGQWTQLPNSSSALEPQALSFSEWSGEGHEAEWLLARACPPERMIDKRLRSRGLVKTVTVRGSDARSVHHAMSTAFGTLFQNFSRLQTNAHDGPDSSSRATRFLGLQQPWVPLRKIHKDSRLRFLAQSEMVTPALWDVAFLSGVVMKATGIQRLFITQPEAYLQNDEAFENGWDWQRLRELSRVYPDSQSSQRDIPEADAMEECWLWNERLDEQPESQASALRLSLRQATAAAGPSRFVSPSLGSSPQTFFPARTGQTSSASTGNAMSPLVLKARQPSVASSSVRPLHVRTTSMPPNLAPLVSPSQGGRRVTSASGAHPIVYDRRLSPLIGRTVTSTAHGVIAKRRRSARSPSVPLSARLRISPRWSTSPSPFPDGNPFAVPATGVTGPRQPTPGFYATPYSNVAHGDSRFPRMAADLDDDRGSDTDDSFDMADAGPASEGEEGEEEEEDDDDDEADEGDPHQQGDSFMTDPGEVSGRRPVTRSQHGQLPADEVWPGIEDEENMDPEAFALDSSSGDQQVNVYVDDDAMSDLNESGMSDIHILEDADADADAAQRTPRHQNNDDEDDDDDEAGNSSEHSSAPSEMPSTQRAWMEQRGGFNVYEDGHGER